MVFEPILLVFGPFFSDEVRRCIELSCFASTRLPIKKILLFLFLKLKLSEMGSNCCLTPSIDTWGLQLLVNGVQLLVDPASWAVNNNNNTESLLWWVWCCGQSNSSWAQFRFQLDRDKMLSGNSLGPNLLYEDNLSDRFKDDPLRNHLYKVLVFF